MCAGGSCCSNTLVSTTGFASVRPPSTCWTSQCSTAAKMRRSGLVRSISTWLTALLAHDLVLFSRQRLCCRTTSHKLERLRRAASRRVPCTLLVSRLVLAARAHAERSREHARSGSSARWSGTDFAELPGSRESYGGEKRSSSIIYTSRPIDPIAWNVQVFVRVSSCEHVCSP